VAVRHRIPCSELSRGHSASAVSHSPLVFSARYSFRHPGRRMSAHFSGFLSPSAWHARWGLGRRFERRQGVRPTVDRLHRVGLVDGSALYVLSFRSGWVARNPGCLTFAIRSKRNERRTRATRGRSGSNYSLDSCAVITRDAEGDSDSKKKGWRARMSKVSARPLLGQLQAVDLEYPVSICVKIVRGFTARGAEVSSRVVKPHAVIGKLGTWTKGPGRT